MTSNGPPDVETTSFTNDRTENSITKERQPITVQPKLLESETADGVTEKSDAEKGQEEPNGSSFKISGIEYLAHVDTLLVQQKWELMENVTGLESENEYVIKNISGQQIYEAKEESTFYQRFCLGSRRGFEIHIRDNFGNEVIRATRKHKVCACGISCCACAACTSFIVDVEAPVGTKVGYIRQEASCKQYYGLYNEGGKKVLKMVGPCCVCACLYDVHFEISALTGGRNVGSISKEWSGFAREAFSDADNFEITFDKELETKTKAIIMAAVFLIDFMFFERDAGDRH